MKRERRNAQVSLLLILCMLVWPLLAIAQTKVVPPKNPYKPEEDVQLGREAAAEVEKELPVLNNREVQGYVASLGRRLEAAIPPEFQYRQFQYSTKVVDVRDLNAFALPGGFTYVNRGMIEASKTEGELIGVMAHEFSHVALRHGTAQVAKGQKAAVGATIGQVLGAILGGAAGGAVAAASQIGFGAYFLKYSREYERQADTLGAQMMARAGYDPRELANVFQTLERASGGKSGPEWMSSHPNPGNRYEAINREAASLRVQNPIRESGDFVRTLAVLRDMPRARSMEEIANRRGPNPNTGGGRTGGGSGGSTGGSTYRRGEPPSRSVTRYQSRDNLFRLDYPANWRSFEGNDGVTLAPEWAVSNAETTHGAIISINTDAKYRNLRSLDEALDLLVRDYQQGNQNLREERNQRYFGRLNNERAVATYLVNRNSAGETERIWVIARQTDQGLLALLFIAPEQDFRQYESSFSAMIRSFVYDNRR